MAKQAGLQVYLEEVAIMTFTPINTGTVFVVGSKVLRVLVIRVPEQ